MPRAAVSGLLLEAGELVRAVDVKLNAGKLLEGFNRVRKARRLHTRRRASYVVCFRGRISLSTINLS